MHNDLAAITLDESSWTITSVMTGAAQTLSFAEGGASTTAPAGGLSPVADLAPFTPQSGMTQVYLTTAVAYSVTPSASFTLGVRDRRGLTRSVITSTEGDMLVPVGFERDDGTDIPAGSSITLSAAAPGVSLVNTTPGSMVHYTVTTGGISAGEESFTGARRALTLAEGSHVITARATMTGFIDSDPVSITVTVTGELTKLGAVTFRNSDNEPIAAGSSVTIETGVAGTTSVFASSPATGATVRYTVDAGGEQSFTSAQREIPLATGTHTITARALLDGFIDSDLVTITVTVTSSAAVYVHNGTGDDTNPGTEELPCRTISGAYAKFPVKNNTGNRIVLLSHVTTEDGTSGSLANLVITEPTRLVIDGGALLYQFNAAGLSGIRGFSVTGSGTLSLELRNLTIRNGRHASDGAGLYVSNMNASVTLTNCMIADNRIEQATPGTATGAGIYSMGTSLVLQGGTAIQDNHILGATYGYGAGVYLGTGAFNAIGGNISANSLTGPSSGTCTLSGAGLYCNTTDPVSLSGVTISNNTTTLTGTTGPLYGNGSGAFFRGSARTLSNVTISGNTIVDGTGFTSFASGAGLYVESGATTLTGCTIGFNTTNGVTLTCGAGVHCYGYSLTLDLDTTTISNNTGSCDSGYGGGLYVGKGSTVTMTGGAITGNSANTLSGTCQGDGVYITADDVWPSTFTLNSGEISGNASTVNSSNTAFYLDRYVTLLFAEDALVNNDNVVYVYSGAKLESKSWLTNNKVATLQFATYASGTPYFPVHEDTRANYYKFDVVSYGVVRYCINAKGQLSAINETTASTVAELETWLNSAPTDGITREITLVAATYLRENTDGFYIIPESNVRILLNQDTTIDVKYGGVLFMQAPSLVPSNLLIDGETYTLTISYDSSIERSGHVFSAQQGASLVLRGVNIVNARTSQAAPSLASLVYADQATIILDEFGFTDDVTAINSSSSAIYLNSNSTCHFVSGSISGFNTKLNSYGEPTIGGVAWVGNGSILHVYGGGFTNNTLLGGSSVTKFGTGQFLNPLGIIMH